MTEPRIFVDWINSGQEANNSLTRHYCHMMCWPYPCRSAVGPTVGHHQLINVPSPYPLIPRIVKFRCLFRVPRILVNHVFIGIRRHRTVVRILRAIPAVVWSCFLLVKNRLLLHTSLALAFGVPGNVEMSYIGHESRSPESRTLI